jgi:4-aminobutyrate aminotransferase
MHANVLELSPALVLGKTEVTHALEVLDVAIGDVAAGKVSDAAVAPYSGQ